MAKAGNAGYIRPTDTIRATGETRTIAGLTFVFQMAPDTEAPEEFHFYIPELKALTCAENANHSMHNIQTLRGARTRDAANFARYLDEAVELFGGDVEVHYGPHTWPVWGHDDVVEFLSSQRDAYKYLHDQTLRLANHGLHPVEISEALELPAAISAGVVEPRLPRHPEAQRASGVPQGARLLRRQPGQPRPAAAGRIGPAVGGARSVVPTRSSPPPVTRSPPRTTAGSSSSPARPCSPIRPTPRPARCRPTPSSSSGYQAEGPQWRNIYLTAAQELRDGRRARRADQHPRASSRRCRPTSSSTSSPCGSTDPRPSTRTSRSTSTSPTSTSAHSIQVRHGVLHHWPRHLPDAGRHA